MRIECFSRSEWLQIADIISAHCPSEPIIEKFIAAIDDRTNLLSYAHDFFIKNNFNPVFFPDRKTIESCKDGKGLTKRLSVYSSNNGKGMKQFKKDYENYILKKYQITEKQEVNKWHGMKVLKKVNGKH